MVLEATAGVKSLFVQDVHYWASCWEILRKDGVVFRFTDHNAIVPLDGEEYSPLGGLNATAQEHTSGLKGENIDVLGALTDDRITDGDLRAGKCTAHRRRRSSPALCGSTHPNR